MGVSQTPVSVLTTPTLTAEYPSGNGPVMSPATVASPKETASPSSSTLNTNASKKKKKGLFGGFFGGKKNKDKKGNFPTSSADPSKSSPGKGRSRRGKKGQSLNNEDD